MARIIQKKKHNNSSSYESDVCEVQVMPANGTQTVPASQQDGDDDKMSILQICGTGLLVVLAIAAASALAWLAWLALCWLCNVVLPLALQFGLCCVGGFIAVCLIRNFAFRGTNSGEFTADIVLTVVIAIILMICLQSC